MYFGRMATSFAESRWNLVESTMLRMYAQCLKKLNRKDEYVRTLLDLLAKSAANRKSLGLSPKRINSNGFSNAWLDDDKVDTTGVFSELIEFSGQLPKDRTVPIDQYFGDISVEPYVRHYDDRDGFQLRLQIRHLLEDEIDLNRAKVRLVSATAAQVKEIWLENLDPIHLSKGICRIWLGSNVRLYCNGMKNNSDSSR
jgi:trafficking protein particle complex subunit 10